MTSRTTRLIAAALAVLVTTGISGSAALPQDRARVQTGPVYPAEGVWYGMTWINDIPIPSVDTMTANAQRPGKGGTFLCNVPALAKVRNPLNPAGWLAATPWGQGSWVRTDTNTAAFTAVRTIVDESGKFFGWAKFWGTMNLTSANEMTGTMNVQYYWANGTPLFPHNVTGTLQRTRLEIVFEEQ